MPNASAPYHAHIYFSPHERPAAEALHDRFRGLSRPAQTPQIFFVGPLRDRPVGPHPIPQFEIHFAETARQDVIAAIEASGLRALVHPITSDDLADHTTLAHWIGEPLTLDLTVLDPRGANQGVRRFGNTDF